MKKSTHRICAAAVLACTSLALANTAEAVDLRDWGRQFNTASERFVVLSQFNNEAVLDKETQLVWQRSAPANSASWPSAMSQCRYSAAGGRFGWRLPSFPELTSLVGSGGALPAGHPFTNVLSQDLFWSSTDHPVEPTSAHIKQLLGPYAGATAKPAAHRYLCVRGAGAAERG